MQKRLEFILARLAHPVNRLLDIGCGKGVYLDQLSLHSDTMVGIDIDANYLNMARPHLSRPRTHLAQTMAQHLAFSDAAFDSITLIETLEHLADVQTVIAEIARVLRPGGQLFITVPNKLFPVETHPIRVKGKMYGSRWGTGTPLLPLLPRRLRRRFATVHLYYSWELRKLLMENGFTVHLIDYLMPSLDTMEQKLSKVPVVQWIRLLSAWLEKSPLRRFGSTILIHAERTRT